MHARFGQELYPHETLKAAAIVADWCAEKDRRPDTAVVQSICRALPHDSAATRQRIAVKLMQRMIAASPASSSGSASVCDKPRPRDKANNIIAASETDNAGREEAKAAPYDDLNNADLLRKRIEPFARLLAHHPDTQAKRELVYYGAACADTLIAAIARDILYPYFIDGCIPDPYGEDEFIMANAGLLLAPEPILTAGFVSDYARRVWNFDSERTVCLALRILRQAGILAAAPILGTRGRVAAYTFAPHNISLTALLWGMHREYNGIGVAPPWDRVGRAHFARLFVVAPSVVASRLWDAERAGMVGFCSASGTRRVTLKAREADALSRLLLSSPYAK